MSQNTTEIKNLVSKIIKARKIQKARIDNANQSFIQREDVIQKQQKPVVDIIQKTTDQTLKALENQQQQSLLAIQNVTTQATQASQSSKPPQQLWIQELYKSFRKSSKATTKMEMSIASGALGSQGQIDVSLLFNQNIIKIRVPSSKHPLKIQKDLATEGLVALLLLPYEDLRNAEKKGLEITKDDINVYADIMLNVGVEESRHSNKYKEFVKEYELNERQNSEEEPSPVRERTRSEQKRDEQVAKQRLGLGVIAYNDPKELDHRLDLLLGSIKAGNNSKDLRDEVRAILDRLLQINYLPQTLHEKFYKKFNL